MKDWIILFLLSVNSQSGTTAGDVIQAHDAKLANKEIECLALNRYHEARGEPSEGQLAVGMVTMNRVRSGVYPNTVCKVVWQRRQFSWTHDGRSDRPLDKDAYESSRQIAEFVFSKYDALRELSGGDLDITRGAMYYYAPKVVKPYWSHQKQVTTKIGRHVFLKSRS
jgi:spore germination cell wall hydrolase CwlJ-like protein